MMDDKTTDLLIAVILLCCSSESPGVLVTFKCMLRNVGTLYGCSAYDLIADMNCQSPQSHWVLAVNVSHGLYRIFCYVGGGGGGVAVAL